MPGPSWFAPDGTAVELSKEFGVHASSIRSWVRQAKVKGPDVGQTRRLPSALAPVRFASHNFVRDNDSAGRGTRRDHFSDLMNMISAAISRGLSCPSKAGITGG